VRRKLASINGSGAPVFVRDLIQAVLRVTGAGQGEVHLEVWSDGASMAYVVNGDGHHEIGTADWVHVKSAPPSSIIYLVSG
jgi:hypothetical protein